MDFAIHNAQAQSGKVGLIDTYIQYILQDIISGESKRCATLGDVPNICYGKFLPLPILYITICCLLRFELESNISLGN